MIAPKIPPDGGKALQIPDRNITREEKRAIIEEFLPKPTDIQKLAIASVLSDNTDFLNNDEFAKLFKTCLCESSLDEDAICFNGFQSGMGLCGFIPKTWNYVLGNIKKEKNLIIPDRCMVLFTGFDENHPVFSADCNFIFAMYLYKTEGEGHWLSSVDCWKK